MILVMGVSGCGKSTIAEGIADALSLTYVDADDLHPKASVDWMRAGHPLTDDHRWPWLDICARVAQTSDAGIVLACSALKVAYRDRLRATLGPFPIIHLVGTKALLTQRMEARVDHYMPPSLLDSQIATLEETTASERALILNIDQTPAQLVTQSLAYIEAYDV